EAVRLPLLVPGFRPIVLHVTVADVREKGFTESALPMLCHAEGVLDRRVGINRRLILEIPYPLVVVIAQLLRRRLSLPIQDRGRRRLDDWNHGAARFLSFNSLSVSRISFRSWTSSAVSPVGNSPISDSISSSLRLSAALGLGLVRIAFRSSKSFSICG